MKQRLGIAAALLSDPRLLLLDEPANGLDPAGIVAMRETLKHLASVGKTVFISSHILGEVEQLADMVGIIAAGRLVREGPMDQLLLGESVVRVRVAPGEVGAAASVLHDRLPDQVVAAVAGEDGWLSVHVEPGRAAEVNRVLSTAGSTPRAWRPGAISSRSSCRSPGAQEASHEHLLRAGRRDCRAAGSADDRGWS
jgi:ABC-2 type transport system ATP-binding protein